MTMSGAVRILVASGLAVLVAAPAAALPEGALVRIGGPRLVHKGYPYRVAYSPDGKLVASAGYDGLIELWDAATGQEVRKLAGHNGPAYYAASAPDGKILASGGWDRTVRLWDVDKGKEL